MNEQDLPDLVYGVWVVGLAIAILVVLPLTIIVLRRGLHTARRLRTELKELAEAQVRIEQYYRNLAASSGPTEMAALRRLTESLGGQRAPLDETSKGVASAGGPQHLGGAS
jgi:hypothetical protein